VSLIFGKLTLVVGICLGVAMISLMNIMWLQSAPIAFINIGWKF